MLEQAKEIWTKLPRRGKVTTITAMVATLALIGAVVYFGSSEEYAVLFSDLKPENATMIVEKLDAEGIPYRLSGAGTRIEVPRDRVSDTRIKLAGSGVLSGGHVGFDLFDKSSFGATDFAQKVNYRRALEGELSKTLEGMDEVESARVHITPQRESVFAEKERGAKASIMVRVSQGKQLNGERTDAIVALAASSVEGLDPSSISVLDSRGRLLTSAKSGKGPNSDAGNFAEQLDSKHEFELETAARLVAFLEPVAGIGRVRADVSADVDFSQVERTEEKYDPQSQVVRSQRTNTQKSAEKSTSPTNPIVGTRANDPTVPRPETQNNEREGNDESEATTTNYEIDRTITKTVGGGGRVNRMNVSVVVDHKTVEGKRVARTAEELKKLENLVTAAVGADTERGDSVVVQTMPFDQSDALAEETQSFMSQYEPLILTAVKYGSLAVVSLLIFLFLFRPAKNAIAVALGSDDDIKKLPGGEEEAKEDDDEERRLPAADASDLKLEEGEAPLTVTQFEEQMNGKNIEKTSGGNSSESGETENVSGKQLDDMRELLLSGSEENHEIVVGTLRSWLKEDKPKEPETVELAPSAEEEEEEVAATA